MPFITEEIWQNLETRKKGQSISFTKWPTLDFESIDKNMLLEFDHLFKVVAGIRKIRKWGFMGGSF